MRDINQKDGKTVDKIFIWNTLSQNAAQELLHPEGKAPIHVPADTACILQTESSAAKL